MSRFVLALALWLCCGIGFLDAHAAEKVGADFKDYHDKDLTGKNFREASLVGADFTDATLKGADFTRASLKKSTFKDANVEGAYFNEADLTEADLHGITGSAQFSNANLTNANCQGVTIGMYRAKCKGTDFRGAKLVGYLATNDFSTSDLRGASLRGAKLADDNRFKGAFYDDDTAFPDGFDPKAVGMVLKNGDAKDAGPKGADAGDGKPAVGTGKDFHDQDLKGKPFNEASLNGANFTDANLKDADFRNATLKRAKFTGANIENTSFGGADLTGADLSGATGSAGYRETILVNANCKGITLQPYRTKFKGANLKETKFVGYVATNDFSGADLRGASLRGATLTDDNRFKGALYDDDTSFPDSFDPKAAGMVMGKADDKK